MKQLGEPLGVKSAYELRSDQLKYFIIENQTNLTHAEYFGFIMGC